MAVGKLAAISNPPVVTVFVHTLEQRTCGHLAYILAYQYPFSFSFVCFYFLPYATTNMANNKVDLTPTPDPTLVLEEDAPDPPICVPEEPVDAGEGGKLKMIVQLVKKCLGVKDIAAMCVLTTAAIATDPFMPT